MLPSLNTKYGKWGDTFDQIKETKEKPKIICEEKLISKEKVNALQDLWKQVKGSKNSQ